MKFDKFGCKPESARTKKGATPGAAPINDRLVEPKLSRLATPAQASDPENAGSEERQGQRLGDARVRIGECEDQVVVVEVAAFGEVPVFPTDKDHARRGSRPVRNDSANNLNRRD